MKTKRVAQSDTTLVSSLDFNDHDNKLKFETRESTISLTIVFIQIALISFLYNEEDKNVFIHDSLTNMILSEVLLILSTANLFWGKCYS